MPTKNAKPRKSKRVYRPHPLRARAEEFNKDALFVGGGGEFTYDGAILGTAARGQGPEVIVYSQRLIVECGAQKFKDDGDYKTMDEAREASQEWHDFNTFTAWHGEHTPIFVDDWSNDD